MKISKIIIPNFQQFKNFQLDLTYPENHEKAGQPLDKVCFIGRNATGKTTLLEILIELFNEVDFVPPTPSNRWFLVKLIHNNYQFYKIYGHTSTNFIISDNESDKIINNRVSDEITEFLTPSKITIVLIKSIKSTIITTYVYLSTIRNRIRMNSIFTVKIPYRIAIICI